MLIFFDRTPALLTYYLEYPITNLFRIPNNTHVIISRSDISKLVLLIFINLKTILITQLAWHHITVGTLI